MENLLAIGNMLKYWSDVHGVLMDKFCYCFYHPKGILPEYAKVCECRKPDTFFPGQAKNNSILILLNVGLSVTAIQILNAGINLGAKL